MMKKAGRKRLAEKRNIQVGKRVCRRYVRKGRKRECRGRVQRRDSEVPTRRGYAWESKKSRCESECCKLLPVGMMCVADCAR
jgi:hypothetical protein